MVAGLLKVPKRLRGNMGTSHKHAPNQEKATAERLGGVAVKGSGCGFEKGDVRVKGIMRVENKCTQKKSFSLKIEMLSKIENAALSSGEIPAMEIEFIDPRTGKSLHKVAVVPMYVLDMIAGGIIK